MSAPSEVVPRAPVPDAGPKRRHVWLAIVLACLLLAGGVLCSQLAARSIAKRNSERSEQALELSAIEIASTLRLSLQREQDLAVSAAGFFLGSPFASNDQFLAWADTMHAFERYHELTGWGEVVMVTQAQLAGYRARAAADPAGLVSGAFELIPPGDRPFYCFFVSGQARGGGSGGASPDFDYCAGDAGVPLLAARDSGRSSYQSIVTPNGVAPTLTVQVPIYIGGLVRTASRHVVPHSRDGWDWGSMRRCSSTPRSAKI